MKNWKIKNILNQEGEIAVITGGNTGLGFEIAKQLANKNATIIIACRSKDKGVAAIKKMERELNRKIEADVITLDLSNKTSIQKFVETFQKKYKRLDILVNNAGVVSLNDRQETKEGIESHMAINHLGHFILTGLLLPQIKNTPNARVVTMSSGSYLYGELDFEDINWTKREYDKVKCYGASKFANLLFMVQLDRLFKEHNYSAISVGSHPGLSSTKGQKSRASNILLKTMAQSVEKGALPALMGATAKNVNGKSYFGPKWGISGYPKLTKLKDKVFEEELAKKLWRYSEETTGVKYEFIT